jgi:hypothetical protein
MNALALMATKRGCATGVYHWGSYYVFGGLNYIDKCLKQCERYITTQRKWKPIASMHTERKNASSISMTSDSIYVFGGSSNTMVTLDSIE